MKENQVSTLEKVLSFLFPIIGIILYFINKNNVKDSSEYLKCSGIGFLIGVICQLILISVIS